MAENYDAFWPVYLREHARPATRALHYLGTALALCAFAYAVIAQDWLWLIAAPVSGYAFAWIAHMAVERNRPATFTHPFWSLISDFRMFFLWVAGRLEPELRKAGLGGSETQRTG